MLYTPGLTVNLLSMMKRGLFIKFVGEKCTVAKDGLIVATACLQENMFKLNSVKQMCAMATQCDIKLWYARMGHLNYSDLARTRDLVNGMHFQQKNTDSMSKRQNGENTYRAFETSPKDCCNSSTLIFAVQWKKLQ